MVGHFFLCGGGVGWGVHAACEVGCIDLFDILGGSRLVLGGHASVYNFCSGVSWRFFTLGSPSSLKCILVPLFERRYAVWQRVFAEVL